MRPPSRSSPSPCRSSFATPGMIHFRLAPKPKWQGAKDDMLSNRSWHDGTGPYMLRNRWWHAKELIIASWNRWRHFARADDIPCIQSEWVTLWRSALVLGHHSSSERWYPQMIIYLIRRWAQILSVTHSFRALDQHIPLITLKSGQDRTWRHQWQRIGSMDLKIATWILKIVSM